MTHTDQLAFRYAVGSATGNRMRNEDSVFASSRLLAVADGMGGYAHGDVASSTVVGVLIDADGAIDPTQPADVTLRGIVAEALRRINCLAQEHADMALTGSTLTALFWHRDGVAVAHVGDSRGYLVRDGELSQITTDHTFVQSLVDEGRITAEEAAGHPRRSMLTRALQANSPVEPDVTVLPRVEGDRFLLCSDGLTAVVPPDTIRDVLAAATDLDAAVRTLIDEAIQLRSPDNISCVVAEVVSADATTDVLVAGAVAESPVTEEKNWLRRLLS